MKLARCYPARMSASIVHGSALEWTKSPAPGVWRKRLAHSGDAEKGRVTSIVRYEPNCSFPTHQHPEGEEIYVLSGTFADEHGTYPAGSYLLNPPGSRHAPRVADDGCTIFVKLRQYAGAGRKSLLVRPEEMVWHEHPALSGVSIAELYRQDGFPEQTRLLRLEPNTDLPFTAMPGGEEIFVIDGDMSDEHGTYQRHSWVRFASGSGHKPRTSKGCTLYVSKRRGEADETSKARRGLKG